MSAISSASASPARPEPETAPPSAAMSSALAPLAGSVALAELAPGVPERLWRQALLAPIDAILGRPGKGFRGRLVALAHRLGGGAGEPPAALAELFELIHAGSMIVDDIEDGSQKRRGAPAVHVLHGVPLALNAGNWLYFAPLALVAELGLPPPAELRLYRRMSRVMLDCHFGQALDLGARLRTVETRTLADLAASTSMLKTGRLAGLCAYAGAVAAGADEPRARALTAFGEALGVGLQMLDDLGNLSAAAPIDKRYEDLRQGCVTWPWAWAATLDEGRFGFLRDLRERLAAEARLVLGRERDAPRWQPLAEALRALVDVHGRRIAHEHLAAALAQLRAEIGAGPVLDAVALEIERLEVSYG